MPEQKDRDVMVFQHGPLDEFRPISYDDLKQNINRELYSQSGYKLRRISYAFQILLIGVTAVAISFALYTVMWLILNDTIFQMTGRGDLIGQVTWEDFFKITSSFYFWFGFIVLTFPIGMYVFAFLVYFDMLYDSRLVEVSRILSTRSKLRNDFFRLYSSKFTPILQKELERQKKINAYKKIYDDVSARATITHPEDSYNIVESDRLRRKARDLKRSVMTDLLQRLSIRLDESTINGYFFAFTLLVIVVSISFVIPALEFSQIGTIGTNLMGTNSKTRTGEFIPNATNTGVAATVDTSGYLSFWAIEWAVFGAFVYSFISLMDRIPRKDMTPRFYLNMAFRYIFAIALASLFFLIYHQVSLSSGITQNSTLFHGSIAALSFSIGMFPNRYFRLIGSFGDKLGGQFSRDIPLEKFTGISTTEATRFWEEGIENVDQLADSSVQELYAKTRFDPNRLRSLIGRAMLWKYVFGLENMLVLLKVVEKPKDEAAAKAVDARLGEISACRFSDMQSLCAYLFSNPLEALFSHDAMESQINPWACPIIENLDKLSGKIHVPQEILTQVIAMAPFFYVQLIFIDTSVGMTDLVSDDLSEARPQSG